MLAKFASCFLCSVLGVYFFIDYCFFLSTYFIVYCFAAIFGVIIILMFDRGGRISINTDEARESSCT